MRKTYTITHQSRRNTIAWVIGALMAVSLTMSVAAVGVDTTKLDLDRNGADVVSEAKAHPAVIDAARGPDITTLYLDRYGADIPTADWWGRSIYAGNVDARQGPDIMGLIP